MIFIALALIAGIALLVFLIRNLLAGRGQVSADIWDKLKKILKLIICVETAIYVVVFTIVLIKTILA